MAFHAQNYKITRDDNDIMKMFINGKSVWLLKLETRLVVVVTHQHHQNLIGYQEL